MDEVDESGWGELADVDFGVAEMYMDLFRYDNPPLMDRSPSIDENGLRFDEDPSSDDDIHPNTFEPTIGDTIVDSIQNQILILRRIPLPIDTLLAILEFFELNLTPNHTNLHLYQSTHYCGLDSDNDSDNESNPKITTIDTNNEFLLKGMELWSCVFPNGSSTMETFGDVLMVVADLCGNAFESLKLCQNMIGDNGLQQLMGALPHLNKLRELTIAFNDLSWESWDILHMIFQHPISTFHSSLHTLDLSGNSNLFSRTDPSTNSAFSDFCKSCLIGSDIRVLKLSNVEQTKHSITVICEWLVSDNCSLRCLDLSHTSLTEDVVSCLCRTLNRGELGQQSTHNRTTANVTPTTTTTTRAKVDSLAKETHLETLNLSNCKFDPPQCAELFGLSLFNNTTLHTIDMSSLDLMAIVNFCNSKNITNITTLKMSGLFVRTRQHCYDLQPNHVSDALMSILAQKCPYLQNLDISYCDFNNDELKDLTAFMCNHSFLRRINLAKNLINNRIIDALKFAVFESRKFCHTTIHNYVETICKCIDIILLNVIQNNGMDLSWISSMVRMPGINTEDLAAITDSRKYNSHFGVKSSLNVWKGISGTSQLFCESGYREEISVKRESGESSEIGIFPRQLSVLILSYAYANPLAGIESIILQGTYVSPMNAAELRNTKLFGVNPVKQYKFTKHLRKDPFYCKMTSDWK